MSTEAWHFHLQILHNCLAGVQFKTSFENVQPVNPEICSGSAALESPKCTELNCKVLLSCELGDVLVQACDMAQLKSTSPTAPLVITDLSATHKTSPSSTDTACSQDDDEPLELTSNTRPPPVPITTTTTMSLTSASQPQLALAAGTFRWTGRGYEIFPPTSAVLFPGYCDASALVQTGMSSSCHLRAVETFLIKFQSLFLIFSFSIQFLLLPSSGNLFPIQIRWSESNHFFSDIWNYMWRC